MTLGDGDHRVSLDVTMSCANGMLTGRRLWDILGEGEVWHIADFAADFFKKHHRPLRIAVDEPGWRFKNLNAHEVQKIKEGEAAVNVNIARLERPSNLFERQIRSKRSYSRESIVF